jgi:hypothetical protein
MDIKKPVLPGCIDSAIERRHDHAASGAVVAAIKVPPNTLAREVEPSMLDAPAGLAIVLATTP